MTSNAADDGAAAPPGREWATGTGLVMTPREPLKTLHPLAVLRLLTLKQRELLEQIGEAGVLPHGQIRIATAGVLLSKGFIRPSDNGKGFCLTPTGETAYQELWQAKGRARS